MEGTTSGWGTLAAGLAVLLVCLVLAPAGGAFASGATRAAPSYAPRSPPAPTGFSGVNATLFLRNGTLLSGNVPATVQIGPSGAAFDSINGDLYVTDFSTNNLSVVDPATDQIVREIPMGRAPAGAVFDPDNGYVYVGEGYFNGAASSLGVIEVLDPVTNRVVASINPGNYPIGMAYDGWTRELWVVTYGNPASGLVAINTTTDQLVKSAATNGVVDGLAFDPRNGDLYAATSAVVGLLQEGVVAVYNGTTGASIAAVPVGLWPSGLAYDPSNGDLYAVSEYADNVTVIDGSTNRAIGSVDVGAQIPNLPQPFGIAADPRNGDVYVANEWSANVSVIDGATNRLAGTVLAGGGPTAVVVDAAGDAFVTDYGSDNLTVISGVTNAAAASVLIGVSPAVLLADPYNGDVYVGTARSASIAVVNATTHRLVTWIPTEVIPRAFALDPSTGDVLVAGPPGNTNGTLYRIDSATNRVVASWTVAAFPIGIAVDPVREQLYLARDPAYGAPELVVYNSTTMAVVASFNTFPAGVAFDAANDCFYLSKPNSDQVQVYASANNTVMANVSVFGPGPIVYDPANGRLYVATTLGVGVINGTTNQMLGNVSLSNGAVALGLDAPRGLLYVSGGSGNNVTVVSTATDAVLGAVSVGTAPQGIAVDAATGQPFVADWGSGAVSVLAPGGVAPDTTPPVTTLSAVGISGTDGWFVSNVTVTLTASDPDSPVHAIYDRVGGGAWAVYAAPFVLSAGVHTLEYYAVDPTGNAEIRHLTTLRIDLDAPNFTLAEPGGTVTTSTVRLEWNTSTDTAGIAGYTVRVDGGAPANVGNATSETLSLPDGTHSVVVTAYDGAGRTANETFGFSIDTNPFSPTGPYGGTPTYAVILIAAVVLVAFILRRRRRRTEPPTLPPTPPGGT